jgi:hypothetical protein
MGSLGDGLRLMRALALQGHPVLAENASLGSKLFDDLLYEAHNFCVYRVSKLHQRELVSLHRIRSLCKMLRRLT